MHPAPPLTSAQSPTFSGRSLSLLLFLCGVMTGFYVVGDVIGAKLFTFTVFGLTPAHFGLGKPGDPFVATVGTLAFPMTFLLTDIINEYFGRAIVRQLTWVAILVLLCLQPVILGSVLVPTISFTPGITGEQMDQAFKTVLSPAWAIVVGSIAAFALGQYLDIWIFSRLRRLSGGKMLWLRSQGSTLVSQFIDSFVVIFLAFVIIPALVGGQPWDAAGAAKVSITNYVVKVLIAIGVTPVLYLIHAGVEMWLGKTEAHRLANQAHPHP